MALMAQRFERAPAPLVLAPIGSEQLTVGSAAVSLSGLAGKRPTHALIQVTAAPIRWLSSPVTAPTSTVGVRIDAGGFIEWLDLSIDYGQLIEKAQFIRESGVSATLEVLYFD